MTASLHLVQNLVQIGLNEVAQASTLRIVDCLVEGTLITIFAGLVLRAAGLRNSGTRFAVWFAALVAIAAVPFVDGTWAHGVIPEHIFELASDHGARVVGDLLFRCLGRNRWVGFDGGWSRPMASACSSEELRFGSSRSARSTNSRDSCSHPSDETGGVLHV